MSEDEMKEIQSIHEVDDSSDGVLRMNVRNDSCDLEYKCGKDGEEQEEKLETVRDTPRHEVIDINDIIDFVH